MGNSQPTNKTGRQATAQKLENAKKLGVLSLSEHSLEQIPPQVFGPELAGKLRTLDLSKNSLRSLGRINTLGELKSLNLDRNKLPAGSLKPISSLNKLQNLSAAGNLLGKPIPIPQGGDPKQHPATATRREQQQAVPKLPASLKNLSLSSNFLSTVPKQIVSPHLTRLEKLDLSNNNIAGGFEGISALSGLRELNLDSNAIVSLPEEIGRLNKLKVLSLKNNYFRVTSAIFSAKNPQPLPQQLFTDTALIDLNLHGNKMTNTQLNQFEGFQEFLDRRQKVKSKTLTNLDVCGLE